MADRAGGLDPGVDAAEDLVVVITADPDRGVRLDFGAAEDLIDRSIRAAVSAPRDL